MATTKKQTTNQFKDRASTRHDSFYCYDFWPEYIRTKDKVIIVCPIHGKFNQLLNSHLRGSGCKKCAQSKKKNTWLDKYGVDNPAKVPEFKRKQQQTCIDQYGTPTPSKIPDVKQQIKQTKLDRYGNANYNNTDQTKQTKLDRYGDADYNNRHGDLTNKIKQTKASRHGNSNYNNSSKRFNTNLDKFGRIHSSQRNISSEALTKLNDYDWLYAQHITDRLTLTEISNELEVNVTTVCNYMRLSKINTIRHGGQSIAEKNIAEFIRELGVDIICSSRQIISPMELDIYIPQYNIAIEYCGLYWHSDLHSRIDRSYHKRKHDLCAQRGIQLLTIFEDEWRDRQNQVKNKILSKLIHLPSSSIFARKCKIISIDANVKKGFFETNHIQGSGRGAITYGLHCNNELIAAMTFINHKNGEYTLNRYATSCNVPGGFSRLLTHFKRTHIWTTIISFADLRWSDGNLYKKTGWIHDKTIDVDYGYCIDGQLRKHKFNFRRARLAKLLDHYDPSLSEKENCDNNGVWRIWDCGKLRFIMVNEE